MKTNLVKFIPLIAVLLTSCSSTYYYQVYRAVPSDRIVAQDDLLVFEDENCMVSYNLWSEGGSIGFRIYNKTGSNIYLNLEESFFVLNGISNDYYKNRVYTNSMNSGSTSLRNATTISPVIAASKTVVTSSGYSVSFIEEKIVCIPSKTSKIISEYKINETLFRDCDLFKYPTKNQITPLIFSKEESPFVFSNRIAYCVGLTSDLIRFENEFYVTEIINIPESEMFKSKYDEYCNQKMITMTKYFKDVAPDKFYIKYLRPQYDSWLH